MFDKRKLIKIDDYTWEIPTSYNPKMRIPARIYASEQMLDIVTRDKSLEQAANAATLPDLYKYVLVMPDVHQGYGVPIGAVLASDLEKGGIISPGSIGFDINCLSGESKVLLAEGCYLPIKELVKNFKDFKVKVVDKKKLKSKASKVVFSFWRKEKGKILEITTKSGKKIKLTKDHPVFTLEGKKLAFKLKVGDRVLVNPFEGVPYQKPERKLLVDKDKIKEIFFNLGKENKGNSLAQILNHLSKRKLLPLYLDSPKVPYLLKIIGFLFGDGSLTFSKKYKTAQISFYGEKEDLKEIKKDIEEVLGFKAQLYQRKRKHQFYNSYHKKVSFETTEHSLQVSSTSLAILLLALGVPLGKKTHQDYQVPKWIIESPLWYQRLFLASLFGAELQAPKVISGKKYNFYSLQFNLSKAKEFETSGIFFLNQIRKMLSSFGVESSKVVKVPGNTYHGKEGTTFCFRFTILGKDSNLVKFFSKVNYEYNFRKRKLANLACYYLKLKLKVIEERKKVREVVSNVTALSSVKVKDLVPVLASQYVSSNFIEHSAWGRGEALPRVAYNFPSFGEFLSSLDSREGELVFDEVEKIKEIPFKGKVYDLTTKDSNHNFIAEGILVSNCGVRVLVSNFQVEEVKQFIPRLAKEIYKNVPSGLGKGRKERLSKEALDKVLSLGPRFLVEHGIGTKEDLLACESEGRIEFADPSCVSNRAKERGADQAGTLGSGNHFLELQVVDEIFEKDTAEAFGLRKGQLVVMIHCGSRGLGHQVASDYIKEALSWIDKNRISLVDRELAYVPFQSSIGQRYWRAMASAANFAWANRHTIGHYVRKSFENIFGKGNFELQTLYDVAHNIGKIEEHEGKKLLIHRKGATRAFWAGHPELIGKYREVGQPVLIPGSMGTASWILVGDKRSEEKSFGSSCHGAGRVMSRAQAKREVFGANLKRELEAKGIVVETFSLVGLAEEAPRAYKNVDMVVEVVHNVGIARKVARLKPIAVIKGN